MTRSTGSPPRISFPLATTIRRPPAAATLTLPPLNVIYRVGWSAHTGQLYHCNKIYDDRHVIDRSDPNEWWTDDGSACFLNIRDLSEQQVGDLAKDGTNTNWSFSYALPGLPDADANWMFNDLCIGCEWLDGEWPDRADSEWHTLEYTFAGDEFGESAYWYEHRIQPIDSWVGNLGPGLTPGDITPATLTEGPDYSHHVRE